MPPLLSITYFTQVQSEPVPECRLCGHPVCDPCQQQVRFFNCDIDKYRYSQYLEKVSTISLLREPMSILFIYFIYLLVKFSSSTIQQSLTYLVILMFSNMKDNCWLWLKHLARSWPIHMAFKFTFVSVCFVTTGTLLWPPLTPGPWVCLLLRDCCHVPGLHMTISVEHSAESFPTTRAWEVGVAIFVFPQLWFTFQIFIAITIGAF